MGRFGDGRFHRRLLRTPAGRRLPGRQLFWQVLDHRRLLAAVHPGALHPGVREHYVPGYRLVAARHGQWSDQAQHLHADGYDLRPAAAGPGETPRRRLRHFLWGRQHRGGGLLVCHALAARTLRLCDRLPLSRRSHGAGLRLFRGGQAVLRPGGHRPNQVTPEDRAERFRVLARLFGLFLVVVSSGPFSTSRPARGPLFAQSIASCTFWATNSRPTSCRRSTRC